MQTTKTTRICMVRHGETDWNVERRIQGHIDISLNAAGIAQADAAALGLRGHRFDAAYSSDLDRAWQTARTIGQRQGVEVRKAPGLRERNYGVLQGLTTAEIAVRYPQAYARYQARDTEHNFETGESLSAFAERIAVAIETLAVAHPGETLLMVSHGGVLDICYRRATGRGLESSRDFAIPNAALNWFEVGPDGWRLLEWADRRHLERSLDESPE
ncbi:MAG: histidine phosphatase family protein [Gammaproteobacteria bacterium]|nr:histidine phosphatase family protein [Gammaproteobacteria bacterium]MBU1416477.1 histidine phosphatase family protein [Gammaproteobacteria bacterium]